MNKHVKNICQRFALLAALLTSSCIMSGCEGSRKQIEATHESQPANQTSPAVSQSSPKTLVSADELKRLVDSGSNIMILEPAKSKEIFLEGHLPSAQFLDWVSDMTDPENQKRYNIPTLEQFENLMSRLGINNDSSIVIYDRLNSRLSTRLFWTFKYFGHSDVRILDGGFEVWASKFDTVTDLSSHEKSAYKVQQVSDSILAQFDFIRTHLGEAKVKLVDGRPTKQYSGAEPGRVFHTHETHQKNGHIPGAINVFWKDNFNEDGTFKSVNELRKLYQDCGIHPDNCVVTYCNEGLHAAPPWFVLTQLLDYDDVKLYDDSMAEWANGDNPTEKSKE